MDRATFSSERGSVEAGREFWPAVELTDQGNAWQLRAELPGLTEKDIELSATADGVTLRAERKLETPEGHTLHRRERSNFRVARAFTLPSKIDPAKVEAALKNGVLTVTLAKAAEAQPRQVTVKAAS
jgi:HSP20 family protein